MRYFRTEFEMRADQVSMEVFGSVDYTQEILRLNPALTTQPIIPEGTLIKLPDPTEPEPKGINLWS